MNKNLFSVSLWDCSIDSDVFHEWVKTDLLNKVPDQSVVILDNASFHKRLDTQVLLSQHGHTLLFLPSWDCRKIGQKVEIFKRLEKNG